MNKKELIDIVNRVTSNKSMGGFSLVVKDGEMTAFASSAVFMSLVRGKVDLPDMDINVMTDKFTNALDVISDDNVDVIINKGTISFISEKVNVKDIPTIDKRNEIPISSFNEDGYFYYKNNTLPPEIKLVLDMKDLIVVDNKQLPDYVFKTDGTQMIYNNNDPTMYKINNKMEIEDVVGDGQCVLRAEVLPLLKVVKDI